MSFELLTIFDIFDQTNSERKNWTVFDETVKHLIKINKVHAETKNVFLKPIERFIKLTKHLTKQQNI